MRIPTTVAALVLILSAVAGAQDRLADQLRKGVVQEEANGSLEKAIPIYQGIVTQFDQDRQAAATALFRLGECYRKAGKREPAVVAYQRVVREFGDQASLVESSRKQLAGLGVTEAPPGGGNQVAREEYVQVWRQLADKGRELDTANARLNAANARLAELNMKGASGVAAGLGAESQAGTSDSVEALGLQAAALDQRLADMQAKLKAGVISESELQRVTEQYRMVLQRYSEAQRERQVQQKLMQETIKSIEAEILLVQKRIADVEQKISVGVVSPNDAELLQLKRDLLSLQRKMAEVKAGPRR
jgi:tetratricopeptide (TPR) repeat protein